MNLVFESAAGTSLVYAHAAFEPGMSTVLGSDGAALDELVGLAQGERSPRLGRVLVNGAPPATVPAARRRVASLRAVESLPPARHVAGALALVLAARGLAIDARALLGSFELDALASRSPRELGPGELRSLALALALSDEQAGVLALYEPLATELPAARVRTALQDRARSAVVLAATSSLDDARTLAGRWYLLEGGTLSAAAADALAAGLAAEKVLGVRSPDARRLAALTAADAAVSAVEWDELRAPRELRVRGPDLAALARTVTRVALEQGLLIEHLAPFTPPLEALLAARTALVQKAYEAAYQRAAAPAQPAAPPVFAAPYGAVAEYQSPSAGAPPNQSLSLPSAPPDKDGPA